MFDDIIKAAKSDLPATQKALEKEVAAIPIFSGVLKRSE